jgi:hypothetical protein
MLNGMPGLSPKKSNPLPKGLFIGGILVVLILLIGSFWLLIGTATPPEAPEAERVLSAQSSLPFQVLIPAYLPKNFNREKVEINTDQTGPRGEAMIQLIYSTRRGTSLTLSEWMPEADSAQASSKGARCLCVCQAGQQCNMVGMELNVGAVRVRVEFSDPNLLAYEELQFMLDTLGPAANRQVYSAIEDVPLSFSVPPPTEVPIGSDGVQELTLIVTPQGYSPVHFSVKKDVPVRLIFRQLGEVGCGNELFIEWGARDKATLILSSPSDKQTLDFTPSDSGEFQFNCSHLIYRGVMTVTD